MAEMCENKLLYIGKAHLNAYFKRFCKDFIVFLTGHY